TLPDVNPRRATRVGGSAAARAEISTVATATAKASQCLVNVVLYMIVPPYWLLSLTWRDADRMTRGKCLRRTTVRYRTDFALPKNYRLREDGGAASARIPRRDPISDQENVGAEINERWHDSVDRPHPDPGRRSADVGP